MYCIAHARTATQTFSGCARLRNNRLLEIILGYGIVVGDQQHFRALGWTNNNYFTNFIIIIIVFNLLLIYPLLNTLWEMAIHLTRTNLALLPVNNYG